MKRYGNMPILLNLVTSIDILLLWNIKTNTRQKIALIGIFSVTVITMIFAIIRVARLTRVAVVTSQTRTTPDSTWLYCICGVLSH